jgi:arsenate reductase
VNVLFVCRQNAGRSQIAQALYEARGGTARSAGTAPAARVHREVTDVMPELADRLPRALEDGDAEWADVVVTMGCGDACPVIPGKKYVDWELQDPAGQDAETVRAIRDEIDRRVAELPLSR